MCHSLLIKENRTTAHNQQNGPWALKSILSLYPKWTQVFFLKVIMWLLLTHQFNCQHEYNQQRKIIWLPVFDLPIGPPKLFAPLFLNTLIEVSERTNRWR